MSKRGKDAMADLIQEDGGEEKLRWDKIIEEASDDAPEEKSNKMVAEEYNDLFMKRLEKQDRRKAAELASAFIRNEIAMGRAKDDRAEISAELNAIPQLTDEEQKAQHEKAIELRKKAMAYSGEEMAAQGKITNLAAHVILMKNSIVELQKQVDKAREDAIERWNTMSPDERVNHRAMEAQLRALEGLGGFSTDDTPITLRFSDLKEYRETHPEIEMEREADARRIRDRERADRNNLLDKSTELLVGYMESCEAVSQSVHRFFDSRDRSKGSFFIPVVVYSKWMKDLYEVDSKIGKLCKDILDADEENNPNLTFRQRVVRAAIINSSMASSESIIKRVSSMAKYTIVPGKEA